MANLGPPQQTSRTSTSTTLGSTSITRLPADHPLKVAVEKFIKDNSKANLAKFTNTTYDDLRSAISQIQRDQDARRELKNFARVQSFLEAMEQFGKVIEVFLNVADPLAFVWGPMKLLLLAASTFTDSFDALLRAYEQIGELFPLLAEYEALFRTNTHVRHALALMYVDILEFHHEALKFFRGSMWTTFFRAMWKDFETKFSGVLERLDRHRKYVESCAGFAHFHHSNTLHQRIHDEIADFQVTNLAQHQSTQGAVSQGEISNLAQHQNTQDLLSQTQVSNDFQHQSIKDDIARGQVVNLAQHQNTRDGIAQAQQSIFDEFHHFQVANLAQHQSTQDEIARGHASDLDYIQKYDSDMTLLKTETQKHTTDLMRAEADDATRHQIYLDDMAGLANKLDHLMAQEQGKKLATVKDWLAVGQQNSDFHDSYRRIRQDYPSTTQWIVQHEAVRDWLTADAPATPMLWINGIPGAGKTILASAIIDACPPKSVTTSTCYFYCRNDDPTSSLPVGITKALVDQLLDQHRYLLPPCHTARTNSGEPVLRSFPLATKMLREFCLSLDKIFIVVDGLDECNQADRKPFLDALMDIVSQCDIVKPGKLRLLVVSQDFADIRRTFLGSGNAKLAPKIVQISHEDNEHDILMYVKFWVTKRIDPKFELGRDIVLYLVNLTVANAKGMFLFAKLVMCNLYEQPTREMLLDAIRTTNFPTELKDAYQRILIRIEKTSSKAEWIEATKLLGWMVCAKRRLTWKEMQVALSVDTANQTIEYDNKRLRKHIHEICGSLISIHSDQISFVHSTAKTFITQVIPDIDEPSIECDLSVLCLQYLTFPCFDIPENIDEEELGQLALEGFLVLQDYAIAFWFHHINAFVNSGQKFLDQALNKDTRLAAIEEALDDFMAKYGEEDWENGRVDCCKDRCSSFKDFSWHENLVLLVSHIYTFQKFGARHKISLKGLDEALQRNRKVLENLPANIEKRKAADDMATFSKFYDTKGLYKCNRITCRYFAEGFKDKHSRKRHVNIHDRPYNCDEQDCLGQEGFAKENDLRKHMRAYHPEKCDLAENFNKATAKRGKADHACAICGQTFTRSFHRKNHEASHRGERPFSCPECGKAFTRANDCRRHQKIHERRSK